MDEQPLMSRPQQGHLQVCNESDEGTLSIDESFRTPLSAADSPEVDDAVEAAPLLDEVSREERPEAEGATVFQTSLNVAKICCGTGTLALPFAAEKGGILFNLIGLFLIGLWNYYSANCLLRCLEYLPDGAHSKDDVGLEGERSNGRQPAYGTVDSEKEPTTNLIRPPPDGTTTYGRVAWHASGPKGLMVLDLLMISLFFGLLIAYEVAMMSFIDDTPITTGSRKLDLLIPSTIVIVLSCAPDYGFLSKFSGVGLMAVGLSFVVISWQGFEENGCSGFTNTQELNLWPENLSAASSWFGVVVFGFGVVPFVYNFRESMENPQRVNLSLQLGLFEVYIGYIIISNGIQMLFSPSYSFAGDVLQAMPDTWISLVVRLLMTFVVSVTAPLIVIPCGELIEGKLGIENSQHTSMHKRIVVRVTFCLVCIVFSAYVPNGFVHVVSFIGCFCVALTGFVLPPLFCIQLTTKRQSWQGLDSMLLCDIGALMVGIIATAITSVLTFRELIAMEAVED